MNKYRQTPLLKSTIKGMSDEDFTEAREAGRISRKPRVDPWGQVTFSDGVRHVVDAAGTHRNLFPRVRMSKKARRKWRKEQESANS